MTGTAVSLPPLRTRFLDSSPQRVVCSDRWYDECAAAKREGREPVEAVSVVDVEYGADGASCSYCGRSVLSLAPPPGYRA